MTGFTDVFGSQTLPTAEPSYRSLTLISDQRLAWAFQSDGSLPELASVMKVVASSGNSLIFPDARDQSIGYGFLVRNSGSYALGLKDFSLGTVGTLAPGVSYFVYLVDNSTASGTYDFLTFGAGTSTADSASLIGAGIKAMGASLNQSHPTQTYSTTQTITSAHRAQLVIFNGGSVTVNLTSASTLGDDFFFLLKNQGTGTLTIDPAGSETIDGQLTFTVQPGESLMLCCSASSWYTIGYGRSLVYQFTQLVKDVSAGGSFTLTSAEAGNKLITFSGNPSSGVTVNIPAVVAVYYLSNTLSTSQSVTFKTAAGSGVGVPQGARIIAMCDGVNVVSAQSVQANSSISLIDGTSSAPSLSFSSVTNTGIYKQGANGLGITVAGSAHTLFEASAATFNTRVGVGATPPGTQRLLVKQGAGDTYTVDLQGSSSNTTLRLINDLNTVERAALLADSSSALYIRTNGTNAFVIDANKNTAIGMGVASAAGAGRYLDVWNPENTNSSSSAILRLISMNAAGGASASADIMKNKAGAFYFNNNEPTSAGYYAWALNSVEKVRLNSTGLGVLNNNPGYPVDIGSGTGQMVLRLNGANSGTAGGSAVYLSLNGGAHAIGNYSSVAGGAYNADLTLWAGGATNLLFYMGGAEKARMDTNGKLLVGYTASQNAAKLQVSGSQYINSASSFSPGNAQVTGAASTVAGTNGGGYVMVDGTYYLGMYSISGELWFGLGTSGGLNGKASIGTNDLKYFGSAQGNIQANAGNGYASFTAVSTGTNSAYIFFNNGSGERNRISSDNNGTLTLSSGSSTTVAFSVDSSLNAQNYGDQYVVGNSGDSTTRQKRLHFQSNIRTLYFCLNTDNTFNLWDQTAAKNRWTTDGFGNMVVTNNFSAKQIVSTSGKVGYDFGAGGAVTQLTDKTTAVTLNTTSGRINLNSSNIPANSSVAFTFNNSYITENDIILWTVCPSIGGAVNPLNYRVSSGNGAGSCSVKVENLTAGALAQNFAVMFVILKSSEV